MSARIPPLLVAFLCIATLHLAAPSARATDQHYANDTADSLMAPVLAETGHAPIQSMVVRLYFHLLSSTDGSHKWTEQHLNDQIARLRSDYSPLGIYFDVLGHDTVTADNWADGL